MPLQLQYYSWNHLQREQFRNALVRAKGLPIISPSGYYIDENRLPVRHPAKDGKFSAGDILDASLEMIIRDKKG